jgi:AcrR family transcriptional regulator
MSRLKTESYHHGDLRAALLEAAWELVRESGVEGLTLREAARRAGVSPAAPYHHFKDKSELLGEMGAQSLAALDEASRQAIGPTMTAREKLQAIGTAYVMYAVQHPAAFRLMFRPEMGNPFASLAPGCRPVFDLLQSVMAEFHAAGEVGEDTDTALIAAWSLAHGLAVLLLDGPLQPMTADPEQVRRLAEAITAKPPW